MRERDRRGRPELPSHPSQQQPEYYPSRSQAANMPATFKIGCFTHKRNASRLESIVRHRVHLSMDINGPQKKGATPPPPSHVMDNDEGITESFLTLLHYRVPEMQAPSIADFQNGRMHSPTVSNGGRNSALSPLPSISRCGCLIFTRPSFTPRCSKLTQASSEPDPGRDGYKTVSGEC
jgi:hypothetical protein